MGQNSAIEWTDHTFNPWWGCSHVHTGCLNCYAETFAKRTGRAKWGDNPRVVTSAKNWQQPIKWNRAAEKSGERRRVFCASIADVFEDWHGPILNAVGQVLYRPNQDFPKSGYHTNSDVGPCHAVTLDDVRRDLFALIDATPWLDWQLLTKRPENIRKMWTGEPCFSCGGDGLVPSEDDDEEDETCPACEGEKRFAFRKNVWIGTSVSDQPTADKLIPKLLQCRDFAPVLFVSYEPAIGPVNFCAVPDNATRPAEFSPRYTPLGDLDWIIVGGESGPKARPFNVQWARGTIRQCAAAGVACFVKQVGSAPHIPCPECGGIPKSGSIIEETTTGEKLSVVGCFECCDSLTMPVPTRDSKGGDWNEWPADLRVRQFPETALRA